MGVYVLASLIKQILLENPLLTLLHLDKKKVNVLPSLCNESMLYLKKMFCVRLLFEGACLIFWWQVHFGACRFGGFWGGVFCYHGVFFL